MLFPFILTANCHCPWGRLADQRAPVLRPFHVWGHPHTYPQFPAGRSVAWASAHKWCDACGRMYGVPSPLECHAVCLLHPCGHARVHSRVSGVCPCASINHSYSRDIYSPCIQQKLMAAVDVVEVTVAASFSCYATSISCSLSSDHTIV